MKLKLLAGLILAATLYGCSEDTNPKQDGSIQINSDSESLSLRIKREGTGVIGVINPNAASGRILEEATTIPLVLVSQVDAPVYDSKTLKATHVDIEGNYAYVSYNTEGDTYLGAVDIFDISDVYNPVITEQAIFTHTDISSLEYKNGMLYLAAAVDVDSDAEVSSPANMITVSVAGGKFVSDFKFTSLPGYVATDIINTDTQTAVTSGNPGVLALFDSNQAPVNSIEIEDLRSVAYANNKLAALSGVSGLHIFDPITLSETLNIPLTLGDAGAKRTIAIYGQNLFTSEGPSGAGIYHLADGSLVSKLSIPINPEDVASGEIVTNAVSVDQGVLFMANGAAGVSISDVSSVDAIKEIGVLDLDGSSNFVRNENEFVFVATGSGGLQILKIQTVETNPTSGTPASCEGLPAYQGSANFNVNGNESFAYSGAAQMKNVNVGGNFLFCGSLAIEQNLNVNSNGNMEVYGSFAFGQYQKNTSLNVNSNAVLKLSGSIVIYGDLRLNSGAKLEFVGDNNTVTVYGTVTVNSGATISGSFIDTEGKLK